MKYAELIDTDYPMAVGDDRHYSPFSGSVLMWMTPKHFIELAPSGGDPDYWKESEYIQNLAQHIKDGFPIDALELGGGEGTSHDGRHRAHASVMAGARRVPVYVEPQMIPLYDEGFGWNDEVISDVEDGKYDDTSRSRY